MLFDERAEFRDLIGQLPLTLTEFTTFSGSALFPTDVNSLFITALADIDIFGGEIADFLDTLVRRRLEDAFQCRLGG